MHPSPVSASPISHLAVELLQAWIRPDRIGLERELARNLMSRLPLETTREEEEIEVLQAVAARMQSCSPGEDTELDPCVNLLVHLALS